MAALAPCFYVGPGHVPRLKCSETRVGLPPGVMLHAQQWPPTVSLLHHDGLWQNLSAHSASGGGATYNDVPDVSRATGDVHVPREATAAAAAVSHAQATAACASGSKKQRLQSQAGSKPGPGDKRSAPKPAQPAAPRAASNRGADDDVPPPKRAKQGGCEPGTATAFRLRLEAMPDSAFAELEGAYASTYEIKTTYAWDDTSVPSDVTAAIVCEVARRKGVHCLGVIGAHRKHGRFLVPSKFNRVFCGPAQPPHNRGGPLSITAEELAVQSK